MHPEAVHGIVHSEDPNVPLSFLFLLLLYRIHYHMQRPLNYGNADIISDTVHEAKDGRDMTQRMQTGWISLQEAALRRASAKLLSCITFIEWQLERFKEARFSNQHGVH